MSQSTDYSRYLGGTLILHCIKQMATIRKWVTFCVYIYFKHEFIRLVPCVGVQVYHMISLNTHYFMFEIKIGDA